MLHSPCYPKPELIEAIARLGNVAHVVAPNWYRFFGLDGRLRVFSFLKWFGVMERASLRNAAQQIIAWNPERLIVGHGTPVDTDVQAQLRRALHFTGV